MPVQTIENFTFNNDEEYLVLFKGRKIHQSLNNYLKVRIIKSIIECCQYFAEGSRSLDISQKCLSAMIYAFSATKSSYIEKGTIRTMGGFKSVATTELLATTVGKSNTATNPTLKDGKNQKINIGNKEFEFVNIGKLFHLNLINNGIYIEIPNHFLAVKRLLTIFSLFQYRVKSVFYQDKGNETKKTGPDGDSGLRRFRQYGLSKEYYNHYKYLNLPPETKSTIRGATGIGTDMIDYYEMARRNFSYDPDKYEKEKVKSFFKRKLNSFGDTVCVAILEELEKLAKSQKEPGKLMELTMAAATISGVRYDHYFVMPIIAYYGFQYDQVDFSAQGAYKVYLNLKAKCDSEEITTNLFCNDINYAYLISMFDLILADQGLLGYMFGIEPMRRGDLGRKLIKTNEDLPLTMPSLRKWSKAYNGERGDTSKNEQKFVNIVLAGEQQYSSEDFMSRDTIRTRIADPYEALSGVIVNARHNTMHGTIFFGTQLFHSFSDLDKKGEIEGGEAYANTKIVPFFSGPSVDTMDFEDQFEDAEDGNDAEVKGLLSGVQSEPMEASGQEKIGNKKGGKRYKFKGLSPYSKPGRAKKGQR